ncbi:Uncharacterised protein [Mycolicibacterium phlei]|uniref:hypothetical protein n=1 Tax=Mycobacteroides chelonae TaxID=1774 RepID=UPI000618D490|nr:hypothetical protein [Mycobacteroides chelonae]AKC40106.1 hypothetical protein GR01_18200 [Mycobacteroides chelonae]ANB00968.1 hypothetical protein BB28_19110 [Mycobacteroides chelonae CCUG 47445]OLT82482.1 hypothetical protein BKG56_10560 [Mycobacteroides chelonae]VEG19473.1 Uncharacterised protein [Mycolicibacterium phlei]
MRAGKRRGTRATSNNPEVLAQRLPEALRTFDAWRYADHGIPTGIADYQENLSIHLEIQGVAREHAPAVMHAAGLTVASWYRAMLAG